MRGLILCLALIGCAEAAAPPTDVRFLRNPTAPLGSQVDVSAAEIAGDWIVRQAVPGAWPGAARRITFGAEGADLVLRTEAVTCNEADLCEAAAHDVPYPAGLPGRWGDGRSFVAPGLEVPAELWVFWADFDRRTLVLGDPEGRFVVILDRSASGGADRITAARRILQGYGYDLNRLRPVGDGGAA